jgi:hypothetical protein
MKLAEHIFDIPDNEYPLLYEKLRQDNNYDGKVTIKIAVERKK